ncbi:heterokaryon incompatibility protein-domain-containing protein [Ilyonectria destructans]|nr:heterokaryon incompatibility protein-domain-containing protein [Ilyonectria destructans]
MLMKQPATSPKSQDAGDLIAFSTNDICPVCRNFDPHQFTSDCGSPLGPWAPLEYEVPEETVSGRIVVKDSKDLIAAAERDCLFCLMIRVGLGTTRPGWEKENSYMHIYLANGLPLIVRLEFGATAAFKIPREQTLSLGLDVPEDQADPEYLVSYLEAGKEPIEIEIYRPVVPADQLTVGDVALGKLLQHVGFGTPLAEHSGDKQSIDFIKEKIGTCVNQHKCGQDGAVPTLPDRVLWIEANNASTIKLLEPKNIRAPFVALSYCWGPTDAQTFMTTANTLKAMKNSIEYRGLPPLFQDVVDVVRRLGIEYLWIDRLCIIQGDDADFRTQAPKMGEIYGNATVTIAAASATTENDRILLKRSDRMVSGDMGIDVSNFGSMKLSFREVSHEVGKEHSGGDYGKMSTRAWIWQERLLAARTVFFTPRALKFECRCHSFWEGSDEDHACHSWSAKLDKMDLVSWTILVEEFMRRDITRPSDRLPAMETVMKRVEKNTGWTPCWGLWTNSMIEGLAWSSYGPLRQDAHQCRMNPGHYAPTWSWASVDGPIDYSAMQPAPLMGSVRWDLECRSLDSVSGLARFYGHLILLNIHAKVERQKNPPPGQPQFNYEYKVTRGTSEDEGLVVTPDVPLKPGSGVFNGQAFSSAMRVPYGEAIPTETWSSTCACMLVGNKKQGAVVLFLGHSLRHSGTWERIGMGSGLNTAAFRNSPRQLINVS